MRRHPTCRCPYCDTARTRIIATHSGDGGPVERSHQCQACGGTFTSVEVIVRGKPLPPGDPAARRPRRRHKPGRPPTGRIRVKLWLHPAVWRRIVRLGKRAGGAGAVIERRFCAEAPRQS